MNEINLDNSEIIVINGAHCSGAFFKHLASVVSTKKPLIFLPNESVDSHGVLFRLIGRDEINDQQVADAILDAVNHQMNAAYMLRQEALSAAVEDFKEKSEWFKAHTPPEVIQYVKIKKAVIEVVERILQKIGRDK